MIAQGKYLLKRTEREELENCQKALAYIYRKRERATGTAKAHLLFLTPADTNLDGSIAWKKQTASNDVRRHQLFLTSSSYVKTMKLLGFLHLYCIANGICNLTDRFF